MTNESIQPVCCSLFILFCTVALLLTGSNTLAQNLLVSEVGYTIPSNGSIYQITPSGAQTQFATGLDYPFGMAFDSAGNLFVANDFSGNIVEITPNGTHSTFASGLNYPTGVAFNSAGVLFVSDRGSGNIYEYTTNGTQSTFISFDRSGISTIAFNEAGDLFVGMSENPYAYILEVAPNGTIIGSVGSGGSNPEGFTFDEAGDLFVSDLNNSISKITPDGTQTTFASGLNAPSGLAFDASGNLYAADRNSGNIYKFTTNGIQSTFLSGLNGPAAIAFQPIPELQAFAASKTFTINVTMPSPYPYFSTIVQRSKDLVSWCNIYTNTPPFTFTDSIPAGTSSGFYRALLGP
jgi:sugar lactone lactonase YvrE